MPQMLPLDKAAIKAVRSALAALLDNEHLLDLAEKAGVNVAEQRARFEHYKGLATQILAVYEPIVNRLKSTDQ